MQENFGLIFRTLDLGRGSAQINSFFRVRRFNEWPRPHSLNSLLCRIPYQSLHSLNEGKAFSEKALLCTDFSFVASPSPISVPRAAVMYVHLCTRRDLVWLHSEVPELAQPHSSSRLCDIAGLNFV